MLSIYPRVSRIYTPRRSFHFRYPWISIHPPLILNDIFGGRDRASLEKHLEAEIVWTQRWTLRPWSSEFGCALGGRDRVNSEMHSEAGTQRVWRCTWRPRWSELRDALGGRDRASLDMHLEAEIEWTEKCTWRPWSIWFGDALTGYDRARLEEYLEEVNLEILGWCCTWCMLYSVLTDDYGMERERGMT